MTTNETMLADVSAAVEDHQQIKILYTAATRTKLGVVRSSRAK